MGLTCIPYATKELRRAKYNSEKACAAQKKIRAEKRAFIKQLKAARGCMDCGEMDLVVLELDHRDPATKDVRLLYSNAGNKGFGLTGLSWPDLRAEVEKCDVVCANCHRRRTAKQQNWAMY